MSKMKERKCITFTWRRKKYYCYGRTLAEASEKLEDLKRYLKAGKRHCDYNVTLDRFFLRFSDEREGAVRPSTERSNRAAYNRIASFVPNEGEKRLGITRINEIDKDKVIALQKYLSERHSSATVNLTVGLFRRIMRSALSEGLISENPCEGIKDLIRVEAAAREGIHRALSREETRRFFKEAEDSWYHGLYLFLINSGIRCGEAGGLYVMDVKRDIVEIRRTVTRTEEGYIIGEDVKTGAGRRDIPVTRELKDIIISQRIKNRETFGFRKGMTGSGERLFYSPEGRLLLAANVDQDIKRICKKAGVKPFTVHAFRDTFATRAIESGMNPKTLQELLGHSSYSITMDLYAHVMPSTKAEEMKRIRI